MIENLQLSPEDYSSPVARDLVAQMYADLTPLYGGTPSGTFPPLDFDRPGAVFLVARLDGKPAGCGAIVPLEGDCGEVKRMFVRSDLRGRGIARAILAELEGRARGFGYGRLRLETGVKQPEAIRLYEKAGYRRIDNFGHYAGDPTSVCFEKTL